MLMLDSGQAKARQVIEVSRTYLVYLNYFYPDWGHSAIYSSHYSLVVFCSKVSPKSQQWPCSIPACKMIGLNIDKEHTYECIIYTLFHMKPHLCWRPSLYSKSVYCSLYIMIQPLFIWSNETELKIFSLSLHLMALHHLSTRFQWVFCTDACASQ